MGSIKLTTYFPTETMRPKGQELTIKQMKGKTSQPIILYLTKLIQREGKRRHT